ncbi:Uncharacterised protein [Mycobacteroides abscessus subsp. abscessus]|nr:Uncharacterised protein [Mycobacteroides abscessus subsp. abscessus]SHS78015.1 Uncharacterised protein [Mycobacteroides abscessus subsp. abscessus]SHS89070.1 Uncharacterised protein [Mycobacteroides abscessus subsp. abscessus]SHV74075.1 Uncharacterised protein [Mycobacteroides abscessus subsp. abscessus]SIL26629.1 Uncharacterised protein [Mycobacteroides abscessus subsp. abscessus]
MDAVCIDVEAQSGGVSGPQGQGCGGFGFGVEPHQFRQGQGPGFGGDIAQDAPGGDGGKLGVVADSTHARALGFGVRDECV